MILRFCFHRKVNVTLTLITNNELVVKLSSQTLAENIQDDSKGTKHTMFPIYFYENIDNSLL